MATSTVAPQVSNSSIWSFSGSDGMSTCGSATYGYLDSTGRTVYATCSVGQLFASSILNCATNISFTLSIYSVGTNSGSDTGCNAGATSAGYGSYVRVYLDGALWGTQDMAGASSATLNVNTSYSGGGFYIQSYFGATGTTSFFGYKIVVSNITVTYTNNPTQSPTFATDPSVAGSTATAQTWAKPNNSVALSCSANPMTCPAATVSCAWTVKKSGTLIGSYSGFTATCTDLIKAGEYVIRATITGSNGYSTYKEVTITISPLSEEKFLGLYTQLTTQTEITDGTGESKTYRLWYKTTYESAASLSILVNGVTQSLSTHDVWKYTDVTITSNGTYTLTFNATNTYDSSDTYTSSYDLVVDGILQGSGTILYNGQPITNISGRVPNYTPMAITMSGITGYDENATYTWSVVPSDTLYSEISDETITSCTFTPFETTQTYVLTYSITSYGTTKTVTLPAGVVISCYKGVITSFSLDRYEGSTTDEFTTTNASYIPNEDPQPTITAVWTIYDSSGIEVPPSDITIISGSMTSENFVFSMNIPGTFAVTLVSSSSGYEDGTYTRTIQIGLVLDISLGAVSRYSVALDNSGVVALINRNCNTQFSGLVYMKSLNQTGSATFKVIGANKFTKVVGGSVVSATDDLMRVGTRVTIIDNMVPIWIGVISSITEVNQNYFNNVVSTRVFELECDESIKQLSFDYVPLANTGTVNGTIPYIVGKILDSSNIGVVANSLVNYAVSIETTSRLAALDSLSNQLGWRYRCRPEIHMYYQDVSCEIASDGGDDDITATQITDRSGLEAIASDLTGDYVLMNDIDLGGSATPWTPIGTIATPFTGTLNGNGHTISNLYYHGTNVDASIGLFVSCTNSYISNLGLLNIDLLNTAVDENYVQTGGISGGIKGDTSILNCFVTGVINGGTSLTDNRVGGITGISREGTVTISNCWTNVILSAISSEYPVSCGGLVGRLISTYPAIISNCYCLGSASAGPYTTRPANTGGILGGVQGTQTAYATITNCVALQTSLSNSFYVNRVVGATIISDVNNYAYDAMSLTGTVYGVAGIDVTSEEYATKVWWETYPGWGFSSTDAWYWDIVTSLPQLRVFGVAYDTYTIATGSNTTDGCIAVIYDSEGGSGYRIGYIDNFTAGITDKFTFSQKFDTNDFDSTSTSLKVSIYGTYLIDYNPTYYQEYIPVMYKINEYAQNVTDLASSKDKYGEVSVYGVGYSGEHLASNMRAWMIVNPDYTISKSARIATSYDCTLDSISMIDTVVGDVTPSKSFGRYNLVLNGWSFPTTINEDYVPTVFYSNSYEDSGTVYRHLRKVELTYDSDECPDLTQNPRFFYDQNNNKKTSYTISVDLDPSNHDDDGVHYSSVVSSFIPMTNIVFNRVVLAGADGRDGTYWLPAVGKDIRIGDMHATVNNKNATLETLVFDWDVPSVDKVNGVDAPWDDTDTPTPHGHMTDVLVIDDSMTVITEGNYDNPVPGSPKYNYPTINQTILGPEGYSLMELERLACRYMQYGSNYSDRGSCKIPLPVFRRQDYNIGGYRIPMVGDRIAFQKASVNNATSDADYTLQNYELQSYKVDTDKMVCEVKYGMPFVMLGDVLYNMLSNSGMSILPSDSEDNV